MLAAAHNMNDGTVCVCHESTYRDCTLPRPPPVPPPVRPDPDEIDYTLQAILADGVVAKPPVTVLPGNLGAVLASEAGAASMLPDEILAAGVLAKASDPTSQENLGAVLPSEACAAAMSPDEILVAAKVHLLKSHLALVAGVVAKPSVTVLPENLGAVLATESDAASMLTPLQTSDKTQNTEADVAENVVAPHTPFGAGTAGLYFASPGATPPRPAVTPKSKASDSPLDAPSPIKNLEPVDEAGLVRLPPHRMKTKGQRAAVPMNVKILLPHAALLTWNSHHNGAGHDGGCPFLKYY